jgi:transcription elongation GreA/GreB family factor
MSTEVVLELKSALAEELERVAAEMALRVQADVARTADAPASPRRSVLQERIRFLGALVAALPGVDSEHLRRGRIGLGSTVRARDLDSRETLTFTIVPGDLVDGSPDKVSLASPMGQALVGSRAGDLVVFETPARVRRLHIERMRTIWQTLDGWQKLSLTER